MKEIMVFEGTEVEVLELGGKAYFNPRHVGKCLGLSDSAVRNHTSEMNTKQVRLLENSDVRSKDSRKLHHNGENFLTESGVFKLIFKSRKPNAEKFTDWVTDWVLPTIRKTGKYEIAKPKEDITLEKEISALLRITQIVPMTPEVYLAAAHKIYKRYGLPVDTLPVLQESEPKPIPIITVKTEPETVNHQTRADVKLLSASQALNYYGCKLGVIKFNRRMIDAEMLSPMKWTSNRGFPMVTNALIGEGLKYGKNTAYTGHHTQYMPRYYEDTFMTLYEKVCGAEKELAMEIASHDS